MLPKEYRLPASTRFVHSKTVTSPLFILKMSNNDLSIARFGFIVTKKLDKRAVVRNRVKRVFRSCIEELREKIKPGYDMLFFLKHEVLESKRENVYNEIQQVFTRHKLIQ